MTAPDASPADRAGKCIWPDHTDQSDCPGDRATVTGADMENNMASGGWAVSTIFSGMITLAAAGLALGQEQDFVGREGSVGSGECATEFVHLRTHRAMPLASKSPS